MRGKITVMMLPVGLKCNMRCVYCYHGGYPRSLDKREKMSDEVLYKVIRSSANLAKDVDFIWHGGEPLLAGKKHFELAVAAQQKIHFTGKIRNMIQTNGTLLSESWCRFFAENHFLVSTSLDGPSEINDVNRVSVGNKGTHRRVVKAIQRWNRTGNQMGAVALITRANVKFPEKTYRGLRKAGLKSCAFHICSQNDEGSFGTVPSTKEAIQFIKRVFDLWLEDDDPAFLIRNFRNVLRVLCGGTTIDCASRINGCWGFIAITANGDVYPCHRFVNRFDFRIGNILEADLTDIYENARALYELMCSLAEKCRQCEWLTMCGGGCAYERIVSNGSFQSAHPTCEVKMALFTHIKTRTNGLIKS